MYRQRKGKESKIATIEMFRSQDLGCIFGFSDTPKATSKNPFKPLYYILSKTSKVLSVSLQLFLLHNIYLGPIALCFALVWLFLHRDRSWDFLHTDRGCFIEMSLLHKMMRIWGTQLSGTVVTSQRLWQDCSILNIYSQQTIMMFVLFLSWTNVMTFLLTHVW